MTTTPARSDWPLPAGRPARPHWWSAQPRPPAPPISARRGYAEVLLVFAAFFAASIVAGGETLARRYPAPSGSWAVFAPAAISELAMSGLAVAVVVLLSARRGITPRLLGLGMPRKADGTPAAGQTFRIGVWAVAALVAGGEITGLLATGKLGQPPHQAGAYLLYATAASVAAGIIEETVALAFVVTTLRQAGRPLPEIVLVAVLLRCSYHDYYGPGVLGIAVWAAVFVWLFLRLGSVLPLIVVHILWDASIFLGQQHGWLLGVAAVRGVLFVTLPIAAAVTWLVEVSDRRRRQLWPPPGDPPGTGYPPGPGYQSGAGYPPGPEGPPPA